MTKHKPNTMTVIDYVLTRLQEIGIRDVFGVPGDFSFPVDDAICQQPHLNHIGCCNELNAAYAADGYARINGLAALSTTYGVGELSAINGIAGSYAEYLPIFHLVGMPPMNMQETQRIVHHTLGNGEFDLFYHMVDPVVCAKAILTPANCASETERLIAAALYHRRPVYMVFPADYATMPVAGTAQPVAPPVSDPDSLDAAVTAILDKIRASTQGCILPGIIVSRCGFEQTATHFIEATGFPFATMFMDKGVLEEAHPNYMGMYDGCLMNESIRNYVENSDCLISIGALLTDISTGAFTARINPAHHINIKHHSVQIGQAHYKQVEMEDILQALSDRLSPTSQYQWPTELRLKEPVGATQDKINAEYLYSRWQQMLRPDDILIAETGTVSMGLGFAAMPARASYQNQGLWCSIGWATPAAFGAAIAAPARRVILICGDGAHQISAQEISQFCQHGIKPIIFILNNQGYLIERLLCNQPEIDYNDIAPWRYALLPKALGCDDWFTTRVSNCEALDQAINIAEQVDSGVYIEVVTDKYVMPKLAQRIHEEKASFYSSA